MRKMLFVVLAVVFVAAMFAPVIRAGPVMASEEVLLASVVPTVTPQEKVGVVAQSPSLGLSAHVHKDFVEVVLGYQSREWVRNRERVRITKWPTAIVASTLGNFNETARKAFSSHSSYGVERA